jgi:hypothetical protein
MIERIDNPALLWEALTEMTGDANRVLEPTGFAIGWRLLNQSGSESWNT